MGVGWLHASDGSNYTDSTRDADISVVSSRHVNKLKKRARLAVVFAMLLLSSATVCANLHGVVGESPELPSLHPASAIFGPAYYLSVSRTPLARSNRYFRLGVQALNAEHYVDAIAYFSDVLSLRRSTAALIDRGYAYRRIGDQRAAIANYSAALTSSPRSTNAFVGRGNAYALLGRYDEALADFNSAISLRPDQADAHTGRAYVLAEQRQYQQAGDEYLFVAQQTSTVQAYMVAGEWYAEAKRYGKAIAAYSEAIRLAPKRAASYVWRARAYRMQGNQTAALADFGKAVAIDPTATDAYWGRGLVFESMGNYEAAAGDYEVLERLLPHSSRPYVYRADTLVTLRRDAEARREYDTANRLTPDDPALSYGRMQFSFYQNEYAAVMADADAWLRIKEASELSDHDRHDMYYVLIWRHMAAQRLGVDDSAMLQRAAMRLDHDSWPYPMIAFYLGQIDETQLRAAAVAGDAPTVRGHQCELGAYLGESAAAHGFEELARKDFIEALPLCPVDFIEKNLARRELARLDALPVRYETTSTRSGRSTSMSRSATIGGTKETAKGGN